MTETSWPKWAESATRGDLIRFATRQRRINLLLYKTFTAMLSRDSDAAIQKLGEAIEADADLGALINELGDGE